MTDMGHEVQVIDSLTKVPREHKMRNASQVIAFLAKRRVEVPTTMYIGYKAAIERSLFHVPTETEVESMFGTQSITLMKATEEMEQVALPLIAPLPNQWAEEIMNKLMTPFQIYQWLKAKLLRWPEDARRDTTPLVQWVRAACT